MKFSYVIKLRCSFIYLINISLYIIVLYNHRFFLCIIDLLIEVFNYHFVSIIYEPRLEKPPVLISLLDEAGLEAT